MSESIKKRLASARRELAELKHKADTVRGVLMQYDEARWWDDDPSATYADEGDLRKENVRLASEIERLEQDVAWLESQIETK
jgi:hypothetical protein